MEEWRTIPFAIDYEISNTGKVRSNRKNFDKYEMSQQTTKKGYKNVLLRTEDGRKSFQVHRLVLMTFKPVDNMENLTVNHIDENKSNNNLDNLEWMTRLENVRYGTGIERCHKKQKDKIYCVELNKYYDGLIEAVNELGIDYGNLSSCCNGKLKTAGGYHWINLTNKRK